MFSLCRDSCFVITTTVSCQTRPKTGHLPPSLYPNDGGIVKAKNGGIVKTTNGGIVKSTNGGIVKSKNGGIVKTLMTKESNHTTMK